MERREVNALRTGVRRKALIVTAPFGAPLPSHCEGSSPLVSEGMEMPGAPRALREQGRRSFGCLIGVSRRLFEM